MKNLLRTGDVINIQKGKKVYVNILEKFVYRNRPFSNEMIQAEIIVGTVLNNFINIEETKETFMSAIQDEFQLRLGKQADENIINSLVEDTLRSYTPETFDTSSLEGEYVVVNTKTESGAGYGRMNIYPDGHHVFAKKLKDGVYDEQGEEISFFQSGCINPSIKDISSVRKMKMNFA